MEELRKLFPFLTDLQLEQYKKLPLLYKEWNDRINVISRKDIDSIYEHHILHSLGIATVTLFKSNAKILDVGTGGGFPGIPLAIMFPETQFYLIDSIGKKIKVVNAIGAELGLTNVKAEQIRAEEVKGKFDFIVSRAVTALPDFFKWVKDKIAKENNHEIKNGILYLKGGDFEEELQQLPVKSTVYPLDKYFEDDFFETKKVVHIILK